jgi:TM2 domain-containing membrane protein YozV
LYDRVPSQAADRKDPLVAGLLSWFIPGLGSFYAGRSGHGVRHVVIHVVALGAVIAGVVSSADAAAGSGINADESRDEVLIIGGTAVLLLNGIWSIITAVGDANAYNRGTGRPGRVVGSLYVDPSVRALSSYGLLAAGVPHPTNTGIQLLSLGF